MAFEIRQIKTIAGLTIILLLFFSFSYYKNMSQDQEIISQGLLFGSVALDIELAKTETEKFQGLSGRKSFPEKTGMLFIYDSPGYYSFWMKDMHFSIDIVWLDGNWQVVDIVEHVTPETFPRSSHPKEKAVYALEVNAGLVAKNAWQIGQSLRPSDELKIFLK
ncbi:MAG: hypothetical protein A3J48_01550 [Candidatus Doudnabacteria bacterium RIFCSPHIGHO2_02_FULL_46_11]|uniref:DUF192 domain-containing protein n=1 Tax=Candidatus Doudnabacteria bacterium RIFCSPHIGHO2_02_FULL_46_11 TaxID=1817832 RepID=A0A1F5P9Q2_9BACT|nr:MAG: hypothetical protein A3J48_01550 [Candidatus Doudnabacteria bacterium RIFCSPHIGHO2_02_FULL_46_11]